jgi:phage head maturation protease
MEKNSLIADTLYGADRLAYLKEEINLLDERGKMLEENIDEAQAYLAEDKGALIKAGEIAGLSFTFDEDGNVDNYT